MHATVVRCAPAPGSVLCLVGLFTRRVEAFNLQALRDGKVTSPLDQAALAALDTIITYDGELSSALRGLRRYVNSAAFLLIAATVINFALGLIDPQAPTTAP